MSRIKKFILNPWTIGIGTTVLGYLIIKLIDNISGSYILLKIWDLIKIVSNAIANFFGKEYTWKLYGLILLFISGPLLFISISYIKIWLNEKVFYK